MLKQLLPVGAVGGCGSIMRLCLAGIDWLCQLKRIACKIAQAVWAGLLSIVLKQVSKRLAKGHFGLFSVWTVVRINTYQIRL